jgi:5-(carboxyamino)imidazole ribonucleotide mutase
MEILIILGSKSDMGVAEKAKEVLDELGVEYEITIASAHRTPERVRELAEKTEAKVIIAIAGLSAALPGAVASHTIKPVIGVPVSGKLDLDAILSTLQMPPGIPVGAVGLDNGKNAALLAVEILALGDKDIENRLREYRRKMEGKVLADAENFTSE